MTIRTELRRAALPALLLLCACSSDSWTEAVASRLTANQTAQLQRAEAARDELASELTGALRSALGEGGAAGAIDVCRRQAVEIAGAVGERHGLRIGRTSSKLRNPANRAPDWARAHVEGDNGEQLLMAGPDARLGALFPIRLMPQCVQCHGPRDVWPDDVRSALAEHYPRDRATDFAPGDLRGWFWVEVP